MRIVKIAKAYRHSKEKYYFIGNSALDSENMQIMLI